MPIDRALGSVPLGAARWAALALLCVPVLVTWRANKGDVLRGASDHKAWRDLRWWAVLFTLPYVLVYWLA